MLCCAALSCCNPTIPNAFSQLSSHTSHCSLLSIRQPTYQKATIAHCRPSFHHGLLIEFQSRTRPQPPFVSCFPTNRFQGSHNTVMATTATPSRVVSYSAPSSPLSSLSATPSISSSSPAPSMLSRSPSLPPQLYSATVPTTNCTDTKAMDASCRYPSPTSTAPLSGSASPLKPQNAVDIGEIQVCGSGQPPAKRRKIAERKPRTTEYIDLDSRDEAADAQLDRLLHVLRRKKKIVVIAGAGISVSAGSEYSRSNFLRPLKTLIANRSASPRLPLQPRTLQDPCRQAQNQRRWQGTVRCFGIQRWQIYR